MSGANYENDAFESDSMGRGSALGAHSGATDEKRHLLKLSIDFLAVKDLKLSANIQVQYGLRLSAQAHNFKSSPPTVVNQGQANETKLTNAFASYEFQASKTEIPEILGLNQVVARIIHAPQQSEIGSAVVELRDLLTSPLKKTPQATVRVSDQYLPIRDQMSGTKGLLRCILYLQDMGEVQQQPLPSSGTAIHQQVTHSKSMNENRSPNEGSDYQAVWQLEVWKRSEEAKFKAWLKQREIERIEEITVTWKAKESERERLFNQALNSVAQLETKVRSKALELQRREERIVQLEEELKQKITEVSRQLTVKEEEIMNVKKRFKEERTTLEMDKKRLMAQVEELKVRAEQAESKLFAFKRDIDESPLSVIRAELSHKNLELIESESKAKNAIEERDEARRRFELLKKDMVALKKQLDKEQKEQLQRQAEELEKLKTDIRNKQVQEEERRELNALKSQLSSLTQKLAESQKMQQQISSVPGGPGNRPETINDRSGAFNPFAQNNNFSSQGIISGPQQNIFLDNYAKNQASPQKKTFGGQQGNELERIMGEREDLIRNAGYTTEDPLIQELDRQIRANQLRMLC